jgi:hypothetical protein
MKPVALLARALLVTLPIACGGSVVSTPAEPSVPLIGDWSCVAGLAAGGLTAELQRVMPLPPASASFTAFTAHFRDAASMADVPAVDVSACQVLDETCASPLAEAQADEYGLVTLAVPGGLPSFDGYLQVSTPGMPTNLVFLPGRSPGFGSTALQVDLYTSSAIALAATRAGVTLHPALGVVHVDALDCNGTAAEDVVVAISTGDSAAVTAYATGDGISREASGTDATGVAFAFGVAGGPVGIRATLEGVPVGGALGVARAGAVTSLVVKP